MYRSKRSTTKSFKIWLIGYQPPTQQHTAFFTTEKNPFPRGQPSMKNAVCCCVCGAGTRLKTTNESNTTVELQHSVVMLRSRSRLLFYSRSTINLDPPLTAINCTELFSVSVRSDNCRVVGWVQNKSGPGTK